VAWITFWDLISLFSCHCQGSTLRSQRIKKETPEGHYFCQKITFIAFMVLCCIGPENCLALNALQLFNLPGFLIRKKDSSRLLFAAYSLLIVSLTGSSL
jgi:hypothetical protein